MVMEKEKCSAEQSIGVDRLSLSTDVTRILKAEIENTICVYAKVGTGTADNPVRFCRTYYTITGEYIGKII